MTINSVASYNENISKYLLQLNQRLVHVTDALDLLWHVYEVERDI